MSIKHLRAIGITSIVVFVLGVGSVLLWSQRYNIERLIEKSTLPEPSEYVSSSNLPTASPIIPAASSKAIPSTSPEPIALPTEANLAVPFTPQAPHANWEDPYGELCEEASVLMAMSYLRGQSIPDANFAEHALLGIQAFEEKHFGFYKDTTAEQTAAIFREYYDYDQVALIKNPTAEDIKEAIAAGKLVLVPAAGRMLGNPFFQQPGPLYHMFVVKGYTDAGKFIVNDPGTRRGADFLYDQSVVMNAIHDWRTDQNIELGERVVIVVG